MRMCYVLRSVARVPILFAYTVVHSSRWATAGNGRSEREYGESVWHAPYQNEVIVRGPRRRR